MPPIDFLFGDGWLRAWYLLFYAGMIPTYMFLRLLRRPKDKRRRESLLLTYALASTLLLLFSLLHLGAYLLGMDAGMLRKLFTALVTILLCCTVAWSIIPLLLHTSQSRWMIACIHVLLGCAVIANLWSLWMLRARADGERAAAIILPHAR